ncbi:hypothetical protein KAK07_02885 [Ideonella sp. 4Y16]|uniref:hypothetical protein n=1 Tax=Ideonella alba TaxID=2824118 RepID=UPI001B37358E|nr:hypothetical protein [Ideonella alba]MBQ0942276.1 hypothetical protein [Ideonella alba]
MSPPAPPPVPSAPPPVQRPPIAARRATPPRLMVPALGRRLGLLGLVSVLLAVATCASPAHGWDLGLPRLEDLRPKWAAVELGATEAVVLQLMGDPITRTEAQTLGLQRLTLEWADLPGRCYRAEFVAGRLYQKTASNAH